MSSLQGIAFGFLYQQHSTDLMRCRVCKSEYGEFITLDSKFDADMRLLEVFNEYCGMEAAIGDQLPQILCQTCVKNLENVRVFVQKVKQADYDFRKQLIKSTEHFDVVDNMKDEQKNSPQTLSCSASSPRSNDDEEMLNEVEFLSVIEEEDRLEVLYEALSEASSASVEQKIERNVAEDEEKKLQLIKSNNEASQPNLGLESKKIYSDLKQHNEKSHYVCNYNQCKTVFLRSKSFQENLKLKHPDQQMIKTQKQYKCEKCDKVFKNGQKLKQHDLVHTQSKDYKCPICSKHFATVYRKRDHLRMHANERKFACEYCDKRFTARSSLQIHLPLHTGERPHECNICGKSFVQRSVLTTHQALHTGKTHKCPHCPKMFCRSSQLILHQRSHTGERPYKCSKCNCAYTQKSHLDRHANRHLGIRFKCAKCDKVYTAKSTLMTHAQEEHGDKLYKCSECNLSFVKKKNFQYHVKTKHIYDKDVPPET